LAASTSITVQGAPAKAKGRRGNADGPCRFGDGIGWLVGRLEAARLLEVTQEVMRDGWHLTGDLGYMAGGEVYVTDRKEGSDDHRGAAQIES
jgi:acyl-CoA synthetase (AMP-forming)/AMP-acid ligase II